MADEKDSAPRARPFTPPLPPFRGPATAARVPMNPLTPPEPKRGSLFIGTRTPSKTAVEPQPETDPRLESQTQPIDIAQLALDTTAPEPAAVATSEPTTGAPTTAAPESSRAEAIAATDAMPWLFADPATADRRPTPVAPLAGIATSLVPNSDAAAPEEAAQALSGLPFIDESGAEHEAQVHPPVLRPSGKVHRVGFDVATVLESIASRIRAGALDVPDVDPAAGDAAALATVLAALLRQRGR